MPLNSSLLTARFNEMAALAAIRAALDAIDASVRDPSGKRYNQARLARRERWAQVVALATERVQSQTWDTNVAAKPKRKPVQNPVVKLPNPGDGTAPLTGSPASI